MDSGRRPKRVAHLIQETLSRVILQEFQGDSGLITITRVEMSADLQTAHVYLSLFGAPDEQAVWERLEKSKGYLRRCIASEVKLRYNPTLVFHRDSTPEYGSRIDQLIERLKDDEK
ncbi:MAG: ribosome-binding factor A [Candidatus Aminicenantes bacterium RBG_19FT_COMBO_59_29]|jgi:ribosome-binding factor A|nr:MAG: ribosome-binding factor A [Candidatus Aminicenantes bacterium RBG_19FT_COMBO_59_29]